MRNALAGLVVAIEPWMIEGAPQHYAGKKVVLFREDGSGRKWVQLGGRPANPFGNGLGVASAVAGHAAETDAPAGGGGSSEPASRGAPPGGGHGAHASPLGKSGE